jgi:hypothetical protein
VFESTPAADDTLTKDDYDQVGTLNNPTAMHDGILDIGDITNTAYNSFTFNATGLATISKTGLSRYGAREGHDIEDEQPGGSGAQINTWTTSAADVTGTPQDPKLVVEHSASAPVANNGFALLWA